MALVQVEDFATIIALDIKTSQLFDCFGEHERIVLWNLGQKTYTIRTMLCQDARHVYRDLHFRSLHLACVLCTVASSQ